MQKHDFWLKKLENPALGLDILRIYLGVALLVRGATFIAWPDALTSYMERTGQVLFPMVLSHYIVGAHVAGGILLVLGLGTRVAALAQVPILVGAVFLVHWGEGLLSAGQSLELSALVLVILLVIGIFGPGHFSLDHRLDRSERENSEAPSSAPAAHGENHAARAHS